MGNVIFLRAATARARRTKFTLKRDLRTYQFARREKNQPARRFTETKRQNKKTHEESSSVCERERNDWLNSSLYY